MLNRKAFYDRARAIPFGGRITPQNFAGCEAILDEWEERWSGKDPRCLAYVLATAFHETAGTMAPVREGSSPNRLLSDGQARAAVTRARRAYAGPGPNGQVYYGRGLVQLTWLDNYRTMGRALGLDLVGDPELACQLPVAVRILFEGMFRGVTRKGDFTGKALEDYFSGPRGDLGTTERNRAKEARRIVNGTDRADLVASSFVSFMRAIDEATVPVAAAKRIGGTAALPAPAVVAATEANTADTGQEPATSGTVLASAGAAAAAAAPGLAEKVFGIGSPWAFAAFLTLAVALVVLVYVFRGQIAYRTGV